MIVVKYHKGKYTLPVILEDKSILMKFDTGSQNTVISIKELYPSEKKEQLCKVCERLRKHKVQDFILANKDKISGIWCVAKNARIGDVEIPKLYFNLILDVEHPIALLGDDFISGCKFDHKPDGDVFISAFDHERQTTVLKQQGLEALELNSLECELQEMES